VGQPIDLSARPIGDPNLLRTKWESARFRISGPGLTLGTELPVSDEGTGVFRTMFTFLQPGRFEVVFGARAGTALVHASKVIVVSSNAVVPSPAATLINPSGAPTATPVNPSGAPTATPVNPSGAPTATPVNPSGAPTAPVAATTEPNWL
jgi:hypothetical protein